MTDADYHYIDAYRLIREQSKSDASYPALAKAVAKFVADEVSLALASTEAADALLREARRILPDPAIDDAHPRTKALLARIDTHLSNEGESA